MASIEEKIGELKAQGIELGDMLSFEIPLFDGGALQDFDNGTVYFHPSVGAFLCQGEILRKYKELGEVQCGLGYPVLDEQDNPFVLLGRMQEFEFGALLFPPGDTVTVQFNELIDIPQVVVKIDDSISVGLAPGGLFTLDDLVANIGFGGGEFVIEGLRSILPNLAFRRTFESLGSQQILDLVAKAQEQDPAYSPPNFDNFLEIDCPPGFDTDLLAASLRAWQGVVERAYTAPGASDPVVGTSNPRFIQQQYLEPGPKGISVQAAWAKGADGAAMHMIDIERGWLPDHEDLPSGIQLLDGRMDPRSIGHGTAVLGEIVALDNTVGVVGIAPRASVSLLSSVVPSSADRRQIRDRIADMILKAIPFLSSGDILLLEVHFNDMLDPDRFVPVETDPRVFAAIKLATRLGVIVIEPAGNGGDNLDTFVNDQGKNVLLRTSLDFQDSGAIVIGACQSITLPDNRHARDNRSNFGSRVDCYGWGENITTTGTKSTPVKTDSYMNDMSGTSGASAMIAGVCLLIQNLQVLLTPLSGISGPLRPEQMQLMLRNPPNGTGSPDRIGVMPDFTKIIANEYQ